MRPPTEEERAAICAAIDRRQRARAAGRRWEAPPILPTDTRLPDGREPTAIVGLLLAAPEAWWAAALTTSVESWEGVEVLEAGESGLPAEIEAAAEEMSAERWDVAAAVLQPRKD